MVAFKKFHNKKQCVKTIITVLLLFNASFTQALGKDTSFDGRQAFIPFKTIVIDPGHGGHDKGSKGFENTFEKTVSLTLAKMMKKKLENSYRITLTRTDDYLLDISQRGAKANNIKADLFISIHTGGSFLHEAKGMAIFYHKYVPEKSRSRKDRSQSLFQNGGLTAWDDIQNKHRKDSMALAETLQTHLADHIQSLNIRGLNISVQGAPIMLLSCVDMPGVLLEIGYLTNPYEEKQLNDKNYLSGLADRICEGIDLFFERKSPIPFIDLHEQ
jgi:N-acetylmuramoyl-L-alanine amidase